MTTEDDFQAALDAHPDDWQTRLVFADWLQERGDPRAEGYRALGVGRCGPAALEPSEIWSRRVYQRWGWHISASGRTGTGSIPSYWYAAVAEGVSPYRQRPPMPVVYCGSRRRAEDAAALAFAKLPAARRAELLALAPV